MCAGIWRGWILIPGHVICMCRYLSALVVNCSTWCCAAKYKRDDVTGNCIYLYCCSDSWRMAYNRCICMVWACFPEPLSVIKKVKTVFTLTSWIAFLTTHRGHLLLLDACHPAQLMQQGGLKHSISPCPHYLQLLYPTLEAHHGCVRSHLSCWKHLIRLGTQRLSGTLSHPTWTNTVWSQWWELPCRNWAYMLLEVNRMGPKENGVQVYLWLHSLTTDLTYNIPPSSQAAILPILAMPSTAFWV